MAYYDGNIYAPSGDVRVYDASTGAQGTSVPASLLNTPYGIAVDATGIYYLRHDNNIAEVNIRHYEFDGTLLSSNAVENVNLFNARAIAVTDTHIYLGETVISTSPSLPEIRAYNKSDFSRDSSMDVDPNLSQHDDISGLHFHNQRLYVGYRSGGDSFIDVYYIGGESVDRNYVPHQFDTPDFEDFYALCSDTASGNQVIDRSFSPVRVIKYDKSADTFDTILDEDDGEPQLAHPYTDDGESLLADNRKNFQVVRRSSKTLIFYRRVESAQSSIAVYNETDDAITNIHTTPHSVGDGLPYSMDFALDILSGGIDVYSFVVYYSATNSTLRLYRERFQPSGTQSQRYTETIARVDDDDSNAQYAVSVSDVILNDDDDKWYFVLTWAAEGTGIGKAELCTIAKDGSGSRTVLKTYDDPMLSARSPVEMDGRFFYVEGGWVRREKTSTDDDVPDEEHYYPNEGGTLIEIESDDSLTDHGIIWRSATKADSPEPDAETDVYDGWGLHNAVVSNMIVDDRDNLHLVAGYGLPYDIEDNSPFARTAEPIPNETNFNWIQFGQDLSTKIASFPTNGRRGWDLIQQLAQLMNWEIGFGPAAGKVDAVQAADSAITDWSANASFFFRPRTILPAELRTAITASGTPTTITLNDSGLPAEGSEFPVPPSGERYSVIIDKEMFTYTGVTPDSQGRKLTGIQRSQNGSTTAAHSIDAAAYFVDYFASGEQGTTLVSIQNRSQDFVNLKNDVNIGFGDRVYLAKDQTSIDEHGEKTFNLGTSQPLLSRQDQAWAELIGDTYLDELKEIKEVLQFTLVFSPTLQPGQLVVVYQLDRVRIDFKLFRLLQVQHHTHPRWQTGVRALEIVV